MADLKLDILVLPTYNVKSLGVADASIYSEDPSTILNPTLEVTIPGFDKMILPFSINNFTVYTSSTLGLTEAGTEDIDLPDGVYNLRYSITPAYINFVEKSIMRVDKLQEKFDRAFMKTDMMEHDKAIRTQEKVDLMTVYFFIQGAIAAANNCAVDESTKLYMQADRLLNSLLNGTCGCSGVNYLSRYNGF